jgi:putative oligomerization/nucleic acid binding protein
MVRQLNERGEQITEELARRYGVSSGAVMAMLESLIAGGGSMAQFNHPEFGGLGQWTRGGMTMVGDMFNNALKAKVDGLCSELSNLLAREPFIKRPVSSQSQTQSRSGRNDALGEVSLFVASNGRTAGTWWPADLGAPSSTGSQNELRYAYFPAARRLAINLRGKVTVYDTLDHQIAGVSQQQSGDASFTFVSQRGLVRLADLPIVSGRTGTPAASTRPASSPEDASISTSRPKEPTPLAGSAPAEPAPDRAQQTTAAERQSDDIFAKIERLADLHAKGIVTDEEFAAKKTELLSRL